jgi:hypothetical protein
VTHSNMVELAVWLSVLAAVLLFGSYGIRKIRAALIQKEPSAEELLSKFGEWHRRGELSDAEFRTIKTTLAERLQEESKDKGETG